MGLLSKFESKVEDGIEGAAGAVGRSNLTPVQITKKAEKQMRREKIVGAGKQYAPTLYTVLVSPEDDAKLFKYYPTLAGETETYLVARASEMGLMMDGMPLVRFLADPDLKKGKFDVVAEMVASAIVEKLRDDEMDRYGLPKSARRSNLISSASQRERNLQPNMQPLANLQPAPEPYDADYYEPQEQYDGGYVDPRSSYDNAPAMQQAQPVRPQPPQGGVVYKPSGPPIGENDIQYGGGIPMQQSGVQPQITYNGQYVPAQAPNQGWGQQYAAADQAAREQAMRSRYANDPAAQAANAVNQGMAQRPQSRPSGAPVGAGIDAILGAPGPEEELISALGNNPSSVVRVTLNGSDRSGKDARADSIRLARDRKGAHSQQFPDEPEEPMAPLYEVYFYDEARDRAYNLTGYPQKIGRESSNDIVVPDINISRVHAQVHREPNGTWVITDLGSTNGVYINGRKIQSAPLRDADMITLGSSTLEFQYLE